MIRFKNARIMTMAGEKPFEVKEGEVWTDKDRIALVGAPSQEELSAAEFEREVDAKGNLIMPSFKNAHTHSAMTFLRSYADDLPLQDWLFNKVFPLEAKLTGEDVYYFAKLANLEYLTSGITASFDMYFELDDYVKACTEMGFRSVLCGAVSGDESNSERLEGNYLKYNGLDPLITFRLGFHAEYTCDIKLLERIGALAEKYKAPVSTHNSETAKEVRECVEKYGKTPTELFESLGIYNYGGAGFHCVHMSDNDLDIFKKRGVWAVHNPGSNSKLASGIADIKKMQDKGIGLALGTDGPASNNALDMFREMYLMSGLSKLKENDAAACDANSVLYAATVGGARAMGLNDCDTLEAGKQADLIMIDLYQPNMQPFNNIGKNIVYSGSKANVILTMCAGKVLYEKGEFLTADAFEIYEGAQERAKRIQESVNG
ncbi:MAG: amidohydrolase [Ruminococcus sp.]|nr:amidohydrolase [Ruminococcus sp.]